MSNIKWVQCPACAFRFYIIEEHAGQGFTWFCPKCRHEFKEDESADRIGGAPTRPAMRSIESREGWASPSRVSYMGSPHHAFHASTVLLLSVLVAAACAPAAPSGERSPAPTGGSAQPK